MNESSLDSVKEKLKTLRLKSCADNISQILEWAEKQNSSTLQAIERLLDLELEHRRQNRIHLKFKQSKLFEKPTIDQFDFHFHISRTKQKARILHLMDLDFIPQKKDIIFIGYTGTGKSFLATIGFRGSRTGLGNFLTIGRMEFSFGGAAAEADRS